MQLGDGSQIALRSETTGWAETRMSRTEYRYAHRRGATRLAEEHETLTLTWYPPDDIVAMLAEAGFRDVTVGEIESNDAGATTYSVSARI